MDYHNLGKKNNPEGGVNIDDIEEFDELEHEISKFNSLSESCSWENVLLYSSIILDQHSKDLKVASYFGLAQINLKALDGLEIGLTVLHDLIDLHWERLSPPAQELQQRVNTLNYFVKKAIPALNKTKPKKVHSTKINILDEKIESINKRISDYSEKNYKEFSKISEILEEIEVIDDNNNNQTIKSENVNYNSEKSKTIQSENTPQDTTNKSAKSQTTQRENTSQNQTIKSENVNGKSEKPQPPDNKNQNKEYSELKDIIKELKNIRTYIMIFFKSEQKNLYNPQLYILNRAISWSEIEELPAVIDKNNAEQKTHLPKPNNLDLFKENYKKLTDKENWSEIIQECEQRLYVDKFWLDLNYFTAHALEKLGKDYKNALNAVCMETSAFVNRIKGLIDLQYKDGTSFADVETKKWLKSLSIGTYTDASTNAQPDISFTNVNNIEKKVSASGKCIEFNIEDAKKMNIIIKQ